MALRPADSSGDSSPIQFAFTKHQVGLLLGGLLVLLALSFSLGFVVAERQGGGTGTAEVASSGPDADSAPGTREATVKFDPAAGSSGGPSKGQDDATKIQPSFYKALLEKEAPATQKLDPLNLPAKPAPKSSENGAPQKKKAPSTRTEKKPAAKAETTDSKKKSTASSGRKSGATPRFTIQVISVQKPARAIRILRRLRDMGFSAFIQRVDLKDRGVWLRIRVGRFPDRNAARQVLESLRAKASVQGGQIVPL